MFWLQCHCLLSKSGLKNSGCYECNFFNLCLVVALMPCAGILSNPDNLSKLKDELLGQVFG